MKTSAYAARSAKEPLAPWTLERRQTGPRDVAIDILFCGVCHSDLHTVRGEWEGTVFPCVPGHEIVGRVSEVGSEVRRFKAGGLAAVGCIVDSCRKCANCKAGLEQFCDAPMTGTYNSPDPHLGTVTYGGYSKRIVVDHDYVLRVPDGMDPASVAPLLCAGITTYSPLRHWKVGKGMKVGIVGLGGLGHMGVKLAAAMGAHVVLFTTSPGKKEDAKRLGASDVIVSRDANDMARHANSFDFILDTVSARHDMDGLLQMLKRDATLTLVGAPPEPPTVTPFNLIMRRRQYAGSLIGGIAETQEMLDFCAERKLPADIEIIPIQDIEKAYARMVKGDVKYRFVIDMASLPG
jgi:uncharacterized zinc-type alcohol dehydrogenase-like protein